MRHDYSTDLLVRHWGLIQAGIETAGIDLPGYLLGFHPVSGVGQEVDYSFFEFHNMQIYRILRNLANVNNESSFQP